MTAFSRREMLGTAVGAALAMSEGGGAAATAQPAGGDRLPSFRFAMESTQARVLPGGSAREATVAQFPVSKNIAGVSMYLKPGGLRELHWHANAAEWAFMLKGSARITIVNPEGQWQTVDFGPGDVWYFPRGHGHSIQGIGKDECHFMLIFDNGAFSEFATFSLTDWLGHTPPEVLSKNLGVPVSALAGLPKKEVYIVQGEVPPALPVDPPPGSERSSPLTHKYRLEAQEPRVFNGGTMRIVSAKEFPISTTMTGALMHLKPGGMRELHWHPNADEWQYYISGRARMTVFGSSGRAETVEFGPGDVGYAPMGYGHYIENIGDGDCRVLLALNNGEYQDISLSTWLASNPPALVAANLNLPLEVVARFPKQTVFMAGKAGP